MTTTAELLKTPLHDWHVAHGGRMVEFGGWSMPVQYTSISEEHLATRNAVGVFDISHMGRLSLGRPDAKAFLDSILTRRITDMKVGQVRYSLLCNEQGGILDDVLLYRTGAATEYCLVVNASNRAKIVTWLHTKLANGNCDVALLDNTTKSAMIAVQGPKALNLLSSLGCKIRESEFSDLGDMRYYYCAIVEYQNRSAGIVSRTGYTGEDGFEIICDPTDAKGLWEKIVTAAKAVGGMACGLGARDTLRLEAAMPLYGHELSETINPIQAGLGFAVNLKDREFVGRAALVKFAADQSQPVRVGLQLDGKRVPREGYAVMQGGERVGEVTSGTFSPTFERPIAMAYVRPAARANGTQLSVDIRGTQYPATVVKLPFFEREKKG